jgi:hypothetical protein
MKRTEFIDAVSALVQQWNDEPAVVTGKLSAIYREVRNQTAHELAQAQTQLDEAMKKLHKHYLKG